MGARRSRQRGRAVNGVLLLDKPIGMSSNQALQQVKRLFEARKAGHTGSLDPLASGLLPVCFGHATKLSAFLLDADKRYEVTCRLGQRTDTGDAEGKVVAESDPSHVSEATLRKAIEGFRGPIEQLPPMYSALKHNGQRLYKLAREGIEVERKPRPVTIHGLELIELKHEYASMQVHCSKGTYVRTLVEDIAATLGTHAFVTALRRTAAGPYGARQEGGEADRLEGDVPAPDLLTMTGLEALKARAEQDGQDGLDALLLPVDSAIAQWPPVKLRPESAQYLKNGQPVLVPQAPSEGWVRLYEEDSSFLGMGRITEDGRVAPKRLFQH